MSNNDLLGGVWSGVNRVGRGSLQLGRKVTITAFRGFRIHWQGGCSFLDFFSVKTLHILPTFFCASFFPFFALSAPPFPGHVSSPKSPSFWDLRSTLSRREKATCRGWVLGTVLDGVAPQEKKENPFFLAREKR